MQTLFYAIYAGLFSLFIVNIATNKSRLSFEARLQLSIYSVFSVLWYWLLFHLKDFNVPIGEWILSSAAIVTIIHAIVLMNPRYVTDEVLNSEEHYVNVIKPHLGQRMSHMYEYKNYRKFTLIVIPSLIFLMIIFVIIGPFVGVWAWYISLVLLILCMLIMLIFMALPARSHFVLIHYLNRVKRKSIRFKEYKEIYDAVSLASLHVSASEVEAFNNNFSNSEVKTKHKWFFGNIRRDIYRTRVLEEISILKTYGVLKMRNGILIDVGKKNPDTQSSTTKILKSERIKTKKNQ